VEKATKPKHSTADQVKAADAEKWECVVDVATCAHSKGKRADMW
jgi:hypothetical protein